jgi:CheY-like chemotaxis protein
VTTAREALRFVAEQPVSCLVLDLGLPDMDGLELLEMLRQQSPDARPGVVVYTGRALTRGETHRIQAYVDAIVLKDGNSGQRLLEEVQLFIEHVQDRVQVPTKAKSEGQAAAVSLTGAKILVVDDDMRTVYALAALLRSKGAEVLTADTGREALDVLRENPDVHGVLMDVMMPEMDGYEAMRRIRDVPKHSALPVLALTAKALKGERERCLDAGASDYLTKPVDNEQLLFTLQSWMRVEHHDAR